MLEPQLPAPTCPGRWADQPLRLVSVGGHRSFVRESLCFSLCTLVAALSSMAPRHPPRLHQWRGFLVCGNFSSFTAPSQWCRSCPYSFVSVFSFFLCPTQECGEFLAFWEVWGLLPAFSRCSVGVVPHVDVFLMYFGGGRWSPCLTPPPSWRSPRDTSLLLHVVVVYSLLLPCIPLYEDPTIYLYILPVYLYCW